MQRGAMAKLAARKSEEKRRPSKPTPPAVPSVGIGASAGGIEALTRFFDAMPADSGVAFVVVLHLDPSQESQLAEILARHTSMPVVDIADGMRLEANRVHVIVPDRYVTVRDGRLRLIEPTDPRGRRHPVDVLFASLAEDRRERAICVVLSGTGSNGTHGLKQVRDMGGCALVQDPATARFDGMPRSAIDAKVADEILPPEDMPKVIRRLARRACVAAPASAEAGTASTLDPILALLRIRTGHDFRPYKRGTLLRRTQRRMGLRDRDSLDSYLELLRADPAEVKALARDLMISVTGFFRDPDAWKELDETVLAPLVNGRDTGAPIRIWVPGSASGEEAYSLAMLILERAEAARKRFDLKIFATDSQDENLNVARAGLYPHAAAANVADDRLRRYFQKLDGTYEVTKELREQVLFAPQNMLRDPPFSRLDLVTCRNLLIYLEPDAQRRAVALFHFALREGGHLFLGSAESVGRHEHLFETISKKWRIYRRIGPTRHDIVEFPVQGGGRRAHEPAEPSRHEAEPPARLAELARSTLVNRFAPASVLVDQKGHALYFHGTTGDYLSPPPGHPTRGLLAMAREGLRAKLRDGLHDAAETGQAAAFDAVIRDGQELRAVTVTVAPVPATREASGLLLVSFESKQDAPPAAAPARPTKAPDDGQGERALQDELMSARAELQSTLEQMESGHEELKAANEEVTSVNEELQSTNEELETSKEELQSFNEELHTINSQLQHKNRDLEKANDDLENLLAGSRSATLFLDMDLRVQWFSPATAELLNLRTSDIGRPIGHFASNFADDRLIPDAEAVLAKLAHVEAEVRNDAGRWFLRRMLPYRTRDNRIAGVVVAFTDITERKRAGDAMNEARLYAEAIVETVRQPLLVLDGDLRVWSANAAFYELFQANPAETEKKLVYELGNGQWDIPALHKLLEEILPKDEEFYGYKVDHDFAAIGRRTMLLNARAMARADGREKLILLAIEDVTRRSRAETHRDTLVAEASHRVKNTLATVQSIASQTIQQSESLDTFKAAFEGRLLALARTHDLLVDEGWEGTGIGRIVRRILEPYRAVNGERITAEGPALALRPQSGLALSMILHELATNAAKYGALSAPRGRLKVTWRRDDRADPPHVHLSWIEESGPPVKPPARRGFGTKLIERGTAHELHGKATLDFNENGLHCELSLPWVAPAGQESKGGASHAGAP